MSNFYDARNQSNTFEDDSSSVDDDIVISEYSQNDENEGSDSDSEPVMFLNQIYCRTRRCDSGGKYRIGPTFITKSKLTDMKESKPGRLSLVFDSNEDPMKKSKSALLIYLYSFTERPDKTEIDLMFFKSLLDLGIDINATDENGQTALHAIVRDWHADVAYFAIKNKANVNAQDKFGRTPLHLASAVDNTEVARMLILHGADPNIKTFREFQTAVHFAAKFNSIGVLKEVLKGEGSVITKDQKGRTALFVAAEKGSKDTVEFLLLMGVPLAVYDIFGNSALSHIIEKIPALASLALDQFYECTKINHQVGIYLGQLEKCQDIAELDEDMLDLALTPLEVIIMYNDEKHIMHPVVQKALQLKWKLFGCKYAVYDILTTLLHIIFWMILTYELRNDLYYRMYNYGAEHLSINGWKIAAEVFIVVFTLYFLIREIMLIKHIKHCRKEWIEWRKHQVESNYLYCHPAWPSERVIVASESENLRLIPNLSRHFWLIYEWVNFVLLIIVIVTRIVTIVQQKDMQALLTHDVFVTINLGSAFVRLIKTSLRFKYVRVFFKLASYAIISFFQIFFLFCQFYIPFVAFFWIMFHFPTLKEDSRLSNSTSAVLHMQEMHLEETFYLVFVSAFVSTTEINHLKEVDEEAFKIFASLYQAIVAHIILSIVFGFITARFSTNINHCIAVASLSQANFLIQTEKRLDEKQKNALKTYYKNKCSPFITSKRNPIGPNKPDISRKLLTVQQQVETIDNMLIRHDSSLKKKAKSFRDGGDTVPDSTAIYQNIIKVCRETNKRLNKVQIRLEKELRYLCIQNLVVPKSLSGYLSMLDCNKRKPESPDVDRE